MSFRSAATQRFLLNQELIENITDKWVHLDSIVRPKPFANVQTTKTDGKDLKDELYFGHVELMRQKLQVLEKEVEALQGEIEPDEDSLCLLSQIDDMSKAFETSSGVDIKKVEAAFKTRFNRELTEEKFMVKTIPSLNTDKRSARPTYWKDLKKAREEARLKAEMAAALPAEPAEETQQHHMVAPFSMPEDAIPGQDPMSGFKQPAFGNDDLGIMDDAFGQYSNLDDQDFLSQIDHSMEP